jgi:hypothetical protein
MVLEQIQITHHTNLVTMTVTTPAGTTGVFPALIHWRIVIGVPAGTPAAYTITYQICQNLNPSNCDSAIVTIPVTAATIDAVNDAKLLLMD